MTRSTRLFAILVFTGWAGAADADFISGSISFANGFATIPSLVSTDTFFDIDSASTFAVTSSGDFAGLAPGFVDDAGDIDTLAAGGMLYDIGGFSFDLVSIDDDINTPLTCNAFGLCTDTRTLEISGMASGNGFKANAFIAYWVANGVCAEDADVLGTCIPDTYSSSWSSSLAILCCGVPVPLPPPVWLIIAALPGLVGWKRIV